MLYGRYSNFDILGVYKTINTRITLYQNQTLNKRGTFNIDVGYNAILKTNHVCVCVFVCMCACVLTLSLFLFLSLSLSLSLSHTHTHTQTHSHIHPLIVVKRKLTNRLVIFKRKRMKNLGKFESWVISQPVSLLKCDFQIWNQYISQKLCLWRYNITIYSYADLIF